MDNLIERIKNKTLNLHDDGMPELTIEDIKGFADYYQEIKKLEEYYALSSVGRKQIAEEIKEKLSVLKTFIWLLDSELKGMDSKYNYISSFVSDYEMAMRLLLRLSNSDEEKYIMKKFKVSDAVSVESRHGDRDYGYVDGNLLVIADKNILEKFANEIDTEISYSTSVLYKIISSIVAEGYSLVCLNDHFYPLGGYINSSSDMKNGKIQICGLMSDLHYFLYDDKLKFAVNKFLSFIQENGADLKGINEDILYELMIGRRFFECLAVPNSRNSAFSVTTDQAKQLLEEKANPSVLDEINKRAEEFATNNLIHDGHVKQLQNIKK